MNSGPLATLIHLLSERIYVYNMEDNREVGAQVSLRLDVHPSAPVGDATANHHYSTTLPDTESHAKVQYRCRKFGNQVEAPSFPLKLPGFDLHPFRHRC